MTDSGCFELRISSAGEQMLIPLNLSGGAAAIGRDTGNAVHLNGENVSPVHARLTREEQAVWVEDMESTTGLWVNGERVSGRARLFVDDVLRIAGFEMELRGASLARRGEETTDRTLTPGGVPTAPSQPALDSSHDLRSPATLVPGSPGSAPVASKERRELAAMLDETTAPLTVGPENTLPEVAAPEDTDPAAPQPPPPGFVRRESTEIVPFPGPDDFVPSERTQPAIRAPDSRSGSTPTAELTEIVARPAERSASEETVIVAQIPEPPPGRRLSQRQAQRLEPTGHRVRRFAPAVVLLGGVVAAGAYHYRGSIDLPSLSFLDDLLSGAREPGHALAATPIEGPLAPAVAAARAGRWHEAIAAANEVLAEDPDNSAAMDLALHGELELQAAKAVTAAEVVSGTGNWREAIRILEAIDPSERTEAVSAAIRQARASLAADLLEQARVSIDEGDAPAAETALVRVDILGGPADEVQALRKQLDKKKRAPRKHRRRH